MHQMELHHASITQEDRRRRTGRTLNRNGHDRDIKPGECTALPCGFHGGFHGGGFHHRGFGFGPAIVGGLALGALAGSYAWGPGYYYDDYYYDDYYGDCVPRRRVVGYTPWGRPIVRFVRVCY